jgi:hypothetical protein
VQIVQIQKEQITKELLEIIHNSVFDFELPYEYFRYDLCLAAKDDAGDLMSYVLLREISSETVEFTWGGAVKYSRGTASLKAFNMATEECLKHFKFVTYQTCNKNHKMIKLGLGSGFDIVGCRQTPMGNTYLILNKERK